MSPPWAPVAAQRFSPNGAPVPERSRAPLSAPLLFLGGAAGGAAAGDAAASRPTGVSCDVLVIVALFSDQKFSGIGVL